MSDEHDDDVVVLSKLNDLLKMVITASSTEDRARIAETAASLRDELAKLETLFTGIQQQQQHTMSDGADDRKRARQQQVHNRVDAIIGNLAQTIRFDEIWPSV
jgi:hypothetical protein